MTATSAQFATVFHLGARYRLTTTTNCYYALGADPTATAGADSHLLGAGESVDLAGDVGTKVAVLRVSADGVATLSLLTPKP